MAAPARTRRLSFGIARRRLDGCRTGGPSSTKASRSSRHPAEPVAKPSRNGRYLRIGVIHCVVFARQQSPKRVPAQVPNEDRPHGPLATSPRFPHDSRRRSPPAGVTKGRKTLPSGGPKIGTGPNPPRLKSPLDESSVARQFQHTAKFFRGAPPNRAIIAQPEKTHRPEDQEIEMLVLLLVEIFFIS